MTEDTTQGPRSTTQASEPTTPPPASPSQPSGNTAPPSDYPAQQSGYTTVRAETTAHTYDTERSGWTGWIAFAGVIMIIAGSLNALYGLIALVNDEWVVWTNRSSVYLDLSQWGAVHLVVGLVMLLSGIGVFSGNILARTIGVIVAGLSLLANFFFIPAYPLWALVVITMDLLVIWALTAHGKEMRKA